MTENPSILAQWYLEPILGSYWIVFAIAVALIVLLFATRVAVGLTTKQKYVLILLRASVIVIVVLFMLRPSLISTKTNPIESTLVLMVDQSRSMQVPDVSSSTGDSRWRAQRRTLQQALGVLSEFPDTWNIEFYTYDQMAYPLDVQEGKLVLPDHPEGEQTDIGTSLSHVIEQQRGNQLAAVVLFGDGAQRALKPYVQGQTVARRLALMDCPLFTVSFGRSRDQAQAKDVAIENLGDQFTVFVKNEFQLQASLRVQGYVQHPISVRLLTEDLDGNQESIAPVSVMATVDGERLPVRFAYVPQRAGQYKLTVEAEKQPSELVLENNRMSALLNVREGGLRVLYLRSNLVHQEQKFIRKTLSGAPDIQLYDLAIDRRLGVPPIEMRTHLAEGDYDVLLIGDVDSDLLGTEMIQQIVALVEQGAGLMMLGGYHTLGPGGYANSVLNNVLPIKMDRFQRQEIAWDASVRRGLHLSGDVEARPTGEHFITDLGAESRHIWEQLKPLRGANKLELKADSRAQILMKSSQGEPLLVASEYGGRVLVFAGDSTYRWWRYGQEEAHKRFWRQAILWLGQQEDGQENDVWIRMHRARFRTGEGASFQVGLGGTVVNEESGIHLQARVLLPNGEQQEILLSREEDIWLGSTDVLTLAGDYMVMVQAIRGNDGFGTARSRFFVEDRDLELADPVADPNYMELLSNVTNVAGGKHLAPEQLAEALRQLADRPQESAIEFQSKWRIADTGTDAWLFFLVTLALLASEWYLRRRWGLV